MNCPNCETAMDKVIAVQDRYDPADFHGHSQKEFEFWECEVCGEQVEVN